MASSPVNPGPTPAASNTVGFETSIKIIGGVLAALVAAWTLVDNSNKSYTAIDQEARNELGKWDALRVQYFRVLESLGDDFEAPKEADKLQIDSLCRLAKAKPSEFTGRAVRKIYGLEDSDYKSKKVSEVAEVRRHLVEIIYKYAPARDLPSCAGLFDEVREVQAKEIVAAAPPSAQPVAKAQEIRARVAEDRSKLEKAVTAATEAPKSEALRKQVSRSSYTLSTARASAFNVDVFWCERPLDQPTETRIFLTGQAVAQALGDPRARSLGLGRIRLRPLSIENQAVVGYPSEGFQVRGEAHESEVRDAIVQYLSGVGGLPGFISFQSKTETLKYLSVFVCS